MAVVIAANRTRHPLDARTLARLAVQYADRGVVGFGLSNDERRGRDRRLRAGLRDRPSGPGCCWRRTAASCAGRTTSGSASTTCAPTGSATACGSARTRRCSSGSSPPGVALRGVPGLERGARGLRRPDVGARCRRCSRPGATVALGADDPLLFGSRLAGQYATMRAAHELTRRRRWPSWPGCRSGPRGHRRTCATPLLTDIDAWLAADPAPDAPARGDADQHRLVDEADAEAAPRRRRGPRGPARAGPRWWRRRGW